VLDPKLIRDNPDILRQALLARGQQDETVDALLSKIQTLDAQRRLKITALQEAQTKRNLISKQVGKAKGAGREDEAQALMAEIGALKDTISEAEGREKAIAAELDELLAGLPNIPAEDVPVGGESANTELRRWGEKPGFAFAPKQHFELGEALGLMDFETAAKLSGSRFVVLKGALARMERALAAFMLDLQTAPATKETGGYEEVSPPLLVKDPAMMGTGQLPKFLDDLFRVPYSDASFLQERAEKLSYLLGYEDNHLLAGSYKRAIEDELKAAHHGWPPHRLFLVPTAEVPLTNLVREQILDEAWLPLRYTAHTPCFRSEAGAAGKDTRGMIRLHQFSKVEMVSITTPDTSAAEHERMTACAEEVLKRLGLAYRTIVLATGDMGFSATKTYDIEVWLPGQNAYREISSCSNCGDFQARRMSARYRPKGAKDVRFVHTLNGSGLAVGRTLVAVLENYQQEDGSIRIPEALVPYMGGMTVIPARQ